PDPEAIGLADVDAYAGRRPARILELDVDVLVEAVGAVAASVERCARDRRRRVHTVLDEGVLLAAEVAEPEEAADGDGDAGEHEEPCAQAAPREEGCGELARRHGIGVERLAAE